MRTISNVPIVETGIEYPASTGPVTFTEEDLADIVQAQNDPAIVAPRLKLGHVDPRFNNSALFDGEPAFGTAVNLRLSDNKQTVLADFNGVPDWLADVMPTAYPSRSIEGNWDVETVTGHQYRFVVSDVALLGVVWPGISTLEDLQTATSDGGPEGVIVKTKINNISSVLRASVNLEDVRRQFYEQVATEATGRTWWWVRAVMLDPNELIVDDDDGGLYRVPFEASGDSVTFSDPTPVKIEYVDEQPVAAAVEGSRGVLASAFDNRQASRPAQRQEDNVSPVDLSHLRSILGLPEDATEEQINEALAEQANAPDPPESEAETPESETEPEATPEPEAVAASADTVAVDRATLSTLQANAALGVQAFERQRTEERDRFLSAAVAAGKFPPARLEHWANAWETEHRSLGNADGIRATIEQMPEGLIPTTQMGAAPNQESGSQSPAYPPEWLPEVHRQSHPTISQEA